MSRPDKDKYYLDIALAVSKRSTCLRRRYGCVIVKNDIIVATGYNGSPSGEANCCDCGVCRRADADRYSGYENWPAVHAEQNAVLAVDREHSKDAILYLACEGYIPVTDVWIEDENPKPCGICENMVKNAGIKRVVTRGGELTWA